MNRRQRESLWRVIEAVKQRMPDDAGLLSELLEQRRKRVKEILPRKDQTQITL
jgi:hypothetical protein